MTLAPGVARGNCIRPRAEVSSRQPAMAWPSAPGPIVFGLLAALFYFVTIGGTFMGELAGSVRILNSAIGGALIVVYLLRAPTRNDRVDRVVVLSSSLLDRGSGIEVSASVA